MFGEAEGAGLGQGGAVCLQLCCWIWGSFSLGSCSLWVSCSHRGECGHGLEGAGLPLQVELGDVIPLPTYSVQTSLPNSAFKYTLYQLHRSCSEVLWQGLGG